jgi:hypothetical protein
VVEGQPGQIVHEIPISKWTPEQMDWRCGSRSRAPALQVERPEFKSQSHTKKKSHLTSDLQENRMKNRGSSWIWQVYLLGICLDLLALGFLTTKKVSCAHESE